MVRVELCMAGAACSANTLLPWASKSNDRKHVYLHHTPAHFSPPPKKRCALACTGTMPAFLQISMPVSPPVKEMQAAAGCVVR